MSSCVFCKIVDRSLPAHRIFEDETALAILDINPIRRGHTLIVPKKHYLNFLDIPEEELAHLSILAKKIAPAIMRATDADGFNIIGNNGASAGQIILHTHLHVIPRKTGDPRVRFSETFSWSQGREGDQDISGTAASIRSQLSKRQ